MTNLIEVEFVGGPWDGVGYVHPLTNALYLPVDGHPEGYYMANMWTGIEDAAHGRFLSRYYWLPAVKVERPKVKRWWQKLFGFFT